MTGSSITIGWRRQREQARRAVTLCAWDHDAMDRFNELSRLIAQYEAPAPVLRLLKGGAD
jgi:hypothetical protein